MRYRMLFITGFLAFGFIGINHSFSAENCEALAGYKKYQCQQLKYCVKYKPKSIVFQGKEYPDMEERKITHTSNPLDIFKSTDPIIVGGDIYRENQNNIYACSIVQIQENSYRLIKNKLLKIDKSGTLNGELQKKLDLKLRKLGVLSEKRECNITDTETIYKKKQTLIESSYELCKYMFYLEYAKEYYQNIENVVGVEVDKRDAESYSESLSILNDKLVKKNSAIEKEISHSYKIFELAFHSYIDYENNVGVHILLDLLKQDFLTYRQKLHKALSPINQVVYKVRNAMSIH